MPPRRNTGQVRAPTFGAYDNPAETATEDVEPEAQEPPAAETATPAAPAQPAPAPAKPAKKKKPAAKPGPKFAVARWSSIETAVRANRQSLHCKYPLTDLAVAPSYRLLPEHGLPLACALHSHPRPSASDSRTRRTR